MSEREEKLRNAIRGLMKSYKSLADSGDSGWWKAEEQLEYIACVEALEQADAIKNGPSEEDKNWLLSREEALDNITTKDEAADWTVNTARRLINNLKEYMGIE